MSPDETSKKIMILIPQHAIEKHLTKEGGRFNNLWKIKLTSANRWGRHWLEKLFAKIINEKSIY